MCFLFKMENYPAIKNKDTMKFSAKWIQLDTLIWTEVTQIHKGQAYIHLCILTYKWIITIMSGIHTLLSINQKKWKKMEGPAGQWWHMPLIPALRRQRVVDHLSPRPAWSTEWVPDYSGSPRATQRSPVSTPPKKNKQKNKQNNRKTHMSMVVSHSEEGIKQS